MASKTSHTCSPLGPRCSNWSSSRTQCLAPLGSLSRICRAAEQGPGRGGQTQQQLWCRTAARWPAHVGSALRDKTIQAGAKAAAAEALRGPPCAALHTQGATHPLQQRQLVPRRLSVVLRAAHDLHMRSQRGSVSQHAQESRNPWPAGFPSSGLTVQRRAPPHTPSWRTPAPCPHPAPSTRWSSAPAPGSAARCSGRRRSARPLGRGGSRLQGRRRTGARRARCTSGVTRRRAADHHLHGAQPCAAYLPVQLHSATW